jgi:uncharacterized peroxidase-related enzyme
MIVHPPTADEVEGHAAQMYADDLNADGFVYQYTQAMAINPDAHAAFQALMRAVVPSIGIRTFELATLGAARAIPSPHCLLAHGRKMLRAGGMDEAQLARVGRDYEDAGLSDADIAVMTYAERLSTDPAAMTDDDTRALREVGFSDRQIVDITLAAAVRNYFSRALLALAVPIDQVPGITPDLADALLTPCGTGLDAASRTADA